MAYAACMGLPIFVPAPAKSQRISSVRLDLSNACVRRFAKESSNVPEPSFARRQNLLPKQLLHPTFSTGISYACRIIVQAFSFVPNRLLDGLR